MSDELIKRLKGIDIIYRGTVNLKNAGASDFYVDIKKAYGYPDVLNSISRELWKTMRKDITCIAASGYGGMSPATVISSEHGLNLILVRDEPKKYGKGGWIDGYNPNKKDRVAIVDDVFTTGGSLRKIIEVLKPTEAEIDGCYVIVKRGEGELFSSLTYLFTPEDLI